MDKTRYDFGTRLLWLEACLLPLASGFSEHGIPALRRRGDQHLHVEGNPDEPQHVIGVIALFFARMPDPPVASIQVGK